MSNARQAKLPAPAAVPPSPEVEHHGLAQVIGQSVAYEIAALLTPVLQRLVDVQERPACLPCAARAKRQHVIALANARAAAEVDPPPPPVSQSFTDGARGPVCWACFDPQVDGPFDMAEYLPPAVD